MIINFIPYADKAHFKNLGYAYNQCMERLRDDDWGCFIDHDAMWTTGDWYRHIESIVAENPDYGLFTAVTNRIGRSYQKAPGIDRRSNDIEFHRQWGQRIVKKHGHEVMDVTEQKEISGVVMVLKKEAWSKAKFRERKGKILGVDNAIHRDVRRAGFKVGLMKGIYVYHWYRNSQK
jgi:GT2 family glycosyltransferase